jgi:hypothetical protein
MSTEQEMIVKEDDKKYIDAVFWGGVLLWAGLIFGADALGYLPQIGQASAWSWIFLGAGLYGLVIGFIRLASESFSNPTTWDWVWAVIFLIIGLAGFISINVPWWLILILIGVVILGSALRGRQ